MSLKTAQEMYEAYIEAEKECLMGKSTSVGDRNFSSEDLDKIRAGRKEWAMKLAKAEAGLPDEKVGGGYISFGLPHR